MSEEDNFLSVDHYSLRAIDPKWVEARALELAGNKQVKRLNVLPALEEVAKRLVERAAWNYREGDCLLYRPTEEGDPYIIAVPVKKHSSATVQRTDAPNHPQTIRPDVKTSNLRTEFENLLFEREEGLDARELERNEHDEYVNKEIHQQWLGFEMYHTKLTIAGDPAFREEYNKTLGRYVVGKVSNNGTALFIKTPFRHQTKALAVEDACRLAQSHEVAFGIFRCIDIIKP